MKYPVVLVSLCAFVLACGSGSEGYGEKAGAASGVPGDTCPPAVTVCECELFGGFEYLGVVNDGAVVSALAAVLGERLDRSDAKFVYGKLPVLFDRMGPLVFARLFPRLTREDFEEGVGTCEAKASKGSRSEAAIRERLAPFESPDLSTIADLVHKRASTLVAGPSVENLFPVNSYATPVVGLHTDEYVRLLRDRKFAQILGAFLSHDEPRLRCTTASFSE